MKNKIPIVIASYNRKDMLQDCITGIRGNTKDVDYGLILVDNGSDPETAEFIELQKDKTDVMGTIRLDKNEGFARGYNAGLELANCLIKYESFFYGLMVIINNDTFPSEYWLKRIVELSQSLNCKEKISHVGLVLPYTNFCCNSGIVVKNDRVKTETMKINGNVPAVCWAITLQCYNAVCSIIEKIGGGYNFFHQDFDYGWAEDILTSEIISRLGFAKYAAGGSFIHHHGSATQNILKTVKDYRKENMEKLGKYYEVLNNTEIGSLVEML